MNGQSKKRYYSNLTVPGEKGLDNTINQFVYY